MRRNEVMNKINTGMSKYEIMDKGRELIKELKDRILNGKVVADVIYKDDNCRILVTETETGRYGYAVFEEDKDQPFYLVEADFLIDDLQKRTAYDGTALLYPGAKSMIEKNILGSFTEYFRDPWFESLNLSIKTPVNSSVDVKQRSVIVGEEKQYPTTLLSIDYKQDKVYLGCCADVFISPKTGKKTVSIGCATLDSNGSVNYNELIEDEKHEQRNRRFLGLPYLNDYDIPKYIGYTIKYGQSLLLPMYKALGISLSEEVEYSPLLSEIISGNAERYIDREGNLLGEDGQIIGESLLESKKRK